MASGIYLSMLHMYGLAALTTPYGGALVLKIKLVSIIVVLAAVNRILLIPLLEREAKLRALAYGNRIESLVLVAVLVATGVLATSQPPHDHPAGLTGTAAHPHPVGFDDVPQGASAVVGANRLILPAGTLTVTPTDNGDIALQLRGESAATLELAAVDPNGEVHALATALASGDMLPYEDSLVRLPNGHTGLWTLRGRLNGTSFELAIKIEHLTTPSGVTLSLQLIPAPSLATGGATELFLVATSDDGALTGPVLVQHRRPGMPQALAGAVVTPREQTSRYSPNLSSATLRFPSAGLYELTFIVAGEGAVLMLQVTE